MKNSKFITKVLSVTLSALVFAGNFSQPSVIMADTTQNNESATEKDEENTNEDIETNEDDFTLIAHRGYSAEAPENSIVAFEKAIYAGYTKIELDLRRCKPDSTGVAKWVVSHNDSLKSIIGVNEYVSTSTYQELSKYTYNSGNNIDAYNKLKILTFEEVINLIKKCKSEGNNINWQLELKSVSDSQYTSYFQSELIAPIKDAGIEDCVTFISFSTSYLKEISEIAPEINTVLLSTLLNTTSINNAIKCGAKGITFNGEKASNTESKIKQALDKNLEVGVYTLDSPVTMGVFYTWGVRNFTTNCITPNDISKKSLLANYNINLFTTTLKNTKYTYDGSAKIPDVSVKYKNVELVEGINYKLEYTDNKNPGTAKVVVTGINNCNDSITLNYKINMPEVLGFDITSKASSVTLKWNATKHITGYVVYRYNYTTKAYEAIKTIANPNTTSYKIGNLPSASKYRYRVAAYLVSDGKTYFSSPCDGKTIYTKPATVKISSAKRYSKNTRIKTKWSSSARCTGYEIIVSTDKKAKKIVKTYKTTSKKRSVKIKALSKKKTYYVKVRAYLKVGKTYYYSSYSSAAKSKGVK